MKPENLICTYQGAFAIDRPDVDKNLKKLKSHEIRNLKSFCSIMSSHGLSYADFDGYFVGYTIKQIGKEFDLLRFGDDTILNIELKSEMKVANKAKKILKQMEINYYYLNFLGKRVVVVTYVENDGFYIYVPETKTLEAIDSKKVSYIIRNHVPNMTIDPDCEFVPSNYLISPFNSTDAFINGEYFLTTRQQTIKEEIITELKTTPFSYFCIAANAGTGKTLLTYDIAKEQIQTGKKVVLIHSGKLNEGHQKLKDKFGWTIYSVSQFKRIPVKYVLGECDLMLIDEAQRIRRPQLESIIEYSQNRGIPIIFSYDPKQFLRDGEDRDVQSYLEATHPEIPVKSKKLTTKIRTNKELAVHFLRHELFLP